MMITLTITIRPEMGIAESAQYIQAHFPDRWMTLRADVIKGTVTLELAQERLTDEQRDWLHLSPFAARYIDGYTAEPPAIQEQQTEVEVLRALVRDYHAFAKEVYGRGIDVYTDGQAAQEMSARADALQERARALLGEES